MTVSSARQARATKLSVKVVEDKPTHAAQIEEALSTSPIFKYDVYTTYKGRNVLEESALADIVSLDVDVDNNRYLSKRVARHIRERDPFKSVVFFAEDPGEVLGEPGHFILEKVASVWRAYGRLLVMIWTHDHCLHLLKAVNNYFQNYGQEPYAVEFKKVFEKFQNFYPTLYWVAETAQESDPEMAATYVKLRNTLHGIAEGIVYERKISKSLAKCRRPLLEVVLTEVNKLQNIGGVHLTHTYSREIDELQTSIAASEAAVRRLYPGLWAKVFILEKVSRSMRNIWSVVRPGALGPAGLFPPSGGGGSGGGVGGGHLPPGDVPDDVPEEVRDDAADTVGANDTDDAADAATLYLHAWFVDDEGELLESPLIVGVGASLLVNIIQKLLEDAGGFREELPEEVKSLINSVEYVDIVVSCPDAEVVPLRNRLFMPPDPLKPAKFQVTPHTEGYFDLTLSILIRNEPVHRTVFLCNAVEAPHAGGAGEAGDSHSHEPEPSHTPEGNPEQHARHYERGVTATEPPESREAGD